MRDRNQMMLLTSRLGSVIGVTLGPLFYLSAELEVKVADSVNLS